LILRKLWAFIKRDFLSEASYRLAFVMQLAGLFLSMMALYYLSKMVDPRTEGLGGIPPFPWMLLGLAFQFYFSSALYSFSHKIRNEQLLGTLEAMLVSPTPTSMVVFSSAAWEFTYGAIRLLLYLLFATLILGVHLEVSGLGAFALGVVLTLLSSAGLGVLSASFILYFKRGDPINFMLSGATTLLGSVFFPVEQLPAWVRPASELLPITWSLRVVRGSLLLGQGTAELGRELTVLAVMTVVLLPLGLICSRFAIRRAKREGSLIRY